MSFRLARLVAFALFVSIVVVTPAAPVGAQLDGPVFRFPVDGQILDFEGDYLAAVDPIAGAVSYDWEFSQVGVSIFAVTTQAPEFGFRSDQPERAAVQPGQAQLSVRANLAGGGQVTGETTITIGLTEPALTFVFPRDGQILDFEGDYLARVVAPTNVVSYDWTFSQAGQSIYAVTTTGRNFAFVASQPERAQVQLGTAQISVRANLVGGGSVTSTKTISIRLFSRVPTVGLELSAPTSVDGTDVFDMTARITNLTTVSLGGDFADLVRVGGGVTNVLPLTGQQPLPVIAPGGSATVSFTVRAPVSPATAFDQFVSVTVIDDGVIAVSGFASTSVRVEPVDPCGGVPAVVCYAPELRFDVTEEFLPMDPSDFVLGSELKWAADDGCRDPAIADGDTVGQDVVYVTPELIGNAVIGALEVGEGPVSIPPANCEPIPGRLYTTTDFTRPGSSDNTLDIARVARQDGSTLNTKEGFFFKWTDGLGGLVGGTDSPVFVAEYSNRIEYWVFYGNDPKGRLTPIDDISEHQGDWEHITVRLENNIATTVEYSGHGCDPQVRDYGAGEVDLVGGTHPVVYVAQGSHASWPFSREIPTGPWPEGGCPFIAGSFDNTVYVSGLSKTMQTWNDLRELRAQCWYGFGGAWGDTGLGLTVGLGDDTGPVGAPFNLRDEPDEPSGSNNCEHRWGEPAADTQPLGEISWGEDQRVSYPGGVPGLAYSVTLESVPVSLGDGVVDASGVAEVEFSIPIGTPAGLHMVHIRESGTGVPLAAFSVAVVVPEQCQAANLAADIDGDGVADSCDPNPSDGPLADPDNDGVTNATDNCPLVSNPGQDRIGERSIGVACDQREGYNPLSNQLDPDPTGQPRCDFREATIVGTDGDDVLVGTNGPDVIVGVGGDDVIQAGNGDDIICGGAGNDTVAAQNGHDMVFGGGGDDDVDGGNGEDIIHGGAGNDTITGYNGDDTIYGDDGTDIIDGGNGEDTIHGGAGDDTITGSNGDDVIRGGDGNDIIDGHNGNDDLSGGNGEDTVTGGNGNDVLDGGDGSNNGDGGNGNDTCLAFATVVRCEVLG